MKKKLIGGIAVAAIALTMALNMNLNTQVKSVFNASLNIIEAIAACESVGWWNNDGNCVKNDAGTYFCKSDSWWELTDCLQ